MATKEPRKYNAPVGSTQFRRSVQNVSNFALQLPEHIVAEGRNWYPAVHEAASKGARDIGISTGAASGIVAAVSPNMDFDTRNIHALTEIQSLNSEHWGMIGRSAAQPRIPNPSGKGTKHPGRLPEVAAMLGETAPSLRHATDAHLMDAHRILQGENFREVLNPQTGPKRNRFARNIENPSDPVPVTIDGRQSDIIANTYRPWNWSGRGISSADLPTGKATRYEDHEEVMRRSASVVSRESHFFAGVNGAGLQAVTWVGGKVHEKAWPTKSGNPRKVGAPRQGQRYSDEPQPEWLPTHDAHR